jgi:hypothetical protein
MEKWNCFFTNDKHAKIICNTAIGVMLFIVAYIIMINAHWTVGDDWLFLLTTAIGKNFTYPIGMGRFYPLANYDYNILNYIPYGYSVNAHFMINVISFFLTIFSLTVLLKNDYGEKAGHRYINTFFIIAFPILLLHIIHVFINIVYPERLMCLTLVLFMLCYKKALESKKAWYYVTAFLLAVFTSYSKEPAIGLFCIIAVVNLIFNYKGMGKKERVFYASLILNAMIFIILWYLLSYRWVEKNNFYGGWNGEISFLTKLGIFGKCLMLIPLFILSGVRGYKFLFKKDRSMLYYDSLMFAGVGYAIVMLCLPLIPFPYYYIPAHLLMLPGFIHWMHKLLINKKKYPVISIILVFLLAAGYSSNYVIESIDWHYQSSITTDEGVSKIDWYLKDGRRVIWLKDDKKEDGGFSKTIFEGYLKYYNTKDLGKKMFVAEEDIAHDYVSAIEEGDNGEVDKNAIYISSYNNLPEHNKRYAGFVPTSTIVYYWKQTFTSFVYKGE